MKSDVTVFCTLGNFYPDFNVYFVYFKTFNVFRRKNFLYYLFTFFSSVNTQIRSWVTFCNFSLEMGSPLFSILSHSCVRFSRYSVSADESSACETAESFRSGFGGFSSWGEITPWDVTVWLDLYILWGLIGHQPS